MDPFIQYQGNTADRGKLLPSGSIELEDNTAARKSCEFSFINYGGDEDNILYLEGLTDKGFLKFGTEGAFGIDIKHRFHGKTYEKIYLPLAIASKSLVCYPKGIFENYQTRIKTTEKPPEDYCCPFRPRYCCYIAKP